MYLNVISFQSPLDGMQRNSESLNIRKHINLVFRLDQYFGWTWKSNPKTVSPRILRALVQCFLVYIVAYAGSFFVVVVPISYCFEREFKKMLLSSLFFLFSFSLWKLWGFPWLKLEPHLVPTVCLCMNCPVCHFVSDVIIKTCLLLFWEVFLFHALFSFLISQFCVSGIR